MLGIVHKLHNHLTRLSTPSDTEMTSLTRGRLSPILLTAVTRNLYWRPGRQGTVRVLSLVWPHAHQVSFSLSIFSSWRELLLLSYSFGVFFVNPCLLHFCTGPFMILHAWNTFQTEFDPKRILLGSLNLYMNFDLMLSIVW